MKSDTVSNRKAAAILSVMAVITGTVAYYCLRPVQPQALPPLTLKDPPTAAHTSDSERSHAASSTDSATTEEDATSTGGGIKVHVTGAVIRPGVYSLPSGARVQDAIAAAGGAVPQGDVNAVNQAELLEDGAKIVVPAVGSAAVSSRQPTGGPVVSDAAEWHAPEKGRVIVRQAPGYVPPATSGTTNVPAYSPGVASGNSMPQTGSQTSGDSAGPINLNTASQGQLMQVGRIGAATATKIINYREEHGGFRSVEELRNIRGIGAKTYDQIAPFFTVN
jgi:competence protein ComEA